MVLQQCGHSDVPPPSVAGPGHAAHVLDDFLVWRMRRFSSPRRTTPDDPNRCSVVNSQPCSTSTLPTRPPTITALNRISQRRTANELRHLRPTTYCKIPGCRPRAHSAPRSLRNAHLAGTRSIGSHCSRAQHTTAVELEAPSQSERSPPGA
jgi:hypothetical protein